MEKSQDDFSILFKSFKPADNEEWNKSLMDEVNSIIEELINVVESYSIEDNRAYTLKISIKRYVITP